MCNGKGPAALSESELRDHTNHTHTHTSAFNFKLLLLLLIPSSFGHKAYLSLTQQQQKKQPAKGFWLSHFK